MPRISPFLPKKIVLLLPKPTARRTKVIKAILADTDLPLLSEEGKQTPFEERKSWETFWLVDPLDGTKEFVKRNGEFTVNIALIKKGTPVLGVVFVPVTGMLYFGEEGSGSHYVELGSRDVPISPYAKLLPSPNHCLLQ